MTLANLTEDLNRESTQSLVRDAVQTLASRANGGGDAVLVSGSRRKFRHEFVDLLNLITPDPGTGMARTVDATLGTLTITTGTTAGAETSVTTQDTFTVPFKTSVGLRLSQKIANQEFYVEVVAAGPDVDTTDETIVAAWRIAGSDATSATVARAEVRNGEAARAQSGNITVTNHVGNDAIFEVTLESDEVWFTTKAMDSTNARLAPYVRNSISPDPNERYRVRIRAKNGATAPASSTTLTAYFMVAVDYTEQQVEVTGGNGSIGAAQAIPVAIVGGATTGTPSLAASTTVSGLTPFKVLSAATTNTAVVRGATTRLYGYHLTNTGAATRYVRLYNTSAVPVIGTTAVVMTIAIPAGQTALVSLPVPVSFSTGIGMSIVGGPTDADATAIGANEVVGYILYA